MKWAEQSHAIALKSVYRYPGFSPAGPPKDTVVLDDAYRQEAAKVVDEQLLLGGARLALVLNRILGGKSSHYGVVMNCVHPRGMKMVSERLHTVEGLESHGGVEFLHGSP